MINNQYIKHTCAAAVLTNMDRSIRHIFANLKTSRWHIAADDPKPAKRHRKAFKVSQRVWDSAFLNPRIKF